ncbi:thioredoxin family protein [Radiobacillus kanasensis]|uniref:thioredoxin family protein n=1 Tax=Radiobacillus kanasensis TaxID=2844358 RepID=UPI001E3F7FCA|nr:thioredoxin family protein [Radiobacillus kanasensis]UFT98254.1 thioredoxin family protein [Radiobacillus kanasensis]
MKPFENEDQLEGRLTFLFIHTPFCGTCKVGRTMLLSIEHMWKNELFLEMNAAAFPTFMQKHQIESVPCLLIMDDGEVVDKIYAFRSVQHLYQQIFYYKNTFSSLS